jgi:DNA gyrase subunit A
MTVGGDKGLILSVTENGYGKRTRIGAYRYQSRGGQGVINVKTTDRNGKVMAIMKVSENSGIILITAQGKLIRLESGAIRAVGRSAQGVRLMDLHQGDQVAAACLITHQSERLLDGQAPVIH